MLLSGSIGSSEESVTLLSVFMDHMLLQPLCQEIEGMPAIIVYLLLSCLYRYAGICVEFILQC